MLSGMQLGLQSSTSPPTRPQCSGAAHAAPSMRLHSTALGWPCLQLLTQSQVLAQRSQLLISSGSAVKRRALRQSGVQPAAKLQTLHETSTSNGNYTEHLVRPQEGGERDRDTLNWTKQWYPLAVAEDLDPSRPHAQMLLGKELVLWRDAQQQWRCFADLCPHRKVPLSEGRIEPSDGSLMCGYHGWRFDGTGKAVAIPTVGKTNPAAEPQVCSNCRSACTAYPCQVRQGLVWVWGEAGSAAHAEAAQREPAINPLFESTPKDMWTVGFAQYVRDLPGGFECWIENMCDQSHVAYAHHGVAGTRDGEHAGFFKMHAVHEKGSPQDGFDFDFEWSGGRKPMKTNFKYSPPAYCQFGVAGSKFNLWIYAVPVSADCTRLIINAGGNFNRLSNVASFFSKRRPRWMGHLTLNAVNDGDIVFMHKQSSANRQAAHQHGGRVDWGKHYYTPSEADGGPMLFRRWMDTKGGGGPQYDSALDVGVGLLPCGTAQRMAPHQRRILLDRFGQHTQHCASCSKALKQVRFGIKAATGVSAAALLALAVVLARGSAPVSVAPAALCALALGAALARPQLLKLEKSFVFTDWHNCEQ